METVAWSFKCTASWPDVGSGLESHPSQRCARAAKSLFFKGTECQCLAISAAPPRPSRHGAESPQICFVQWDTGFAGARGAAAAVSSAKVCLSRAESMPQRLLKIPLVAPPIMAASIQTGLRAARAAAARNMSARREICSSAASDGRRWPAAGHAARDLPIRSIEMRIARRSAMKENSRVLESKSDRRRNHKNVATGTKWKTKRGGRRRAPEQSGL